jgi:hypothetical protein
LEVKKMKKFVLAMLFVIVLSSFASAQILVSVDEPTVCGDGKREGHEMCEPETEQDFCEEAGKILGIVMVCDKRDCTCYPERMDCGNEVREGAEYCDPGDKEDKEANDFCPELGELFNETFTCDPDSCLCKPEKIYGMAPPDVCGDGNVTGLEQCETDEDCDEGKICKDCDCTIAERLNVTKAIKDIEEEAKEKPKEKEEDFDYHDLVGEMVPEFLRDDFEEAIANVNVKAKNGSVTVISVVTTHNVVQEINDEPDSRANYDVFVEKDLAEEILAADDKASMLELAFDEGDITYKPKGLFARIWFWFKGLFK